MKIYISADIEGVTGSTHWNETYSTKPDYAEFRDQMTAEVASAAEGALLAGAKELWVQDAHDEGRNIRASKLPGGTRLIRGWSGHPMSMMQELDGSFAAAAMVGYHSRAGSDSNPLAHSMTTALSFIRINDRFASEFLIHAYAAALVGVPVVFVSGDEGVCAEAESVVPAIKTVAVKRGVGGATVSIHPLEAAGRIRDGMKEALSKDISACMMELPERFEVELAFKEHGRARKASFYPGARGEKTHSVLFGAEDYFDVLRFFQFVLF